MHISNWKAKRSGPSITITGTTESGSSVKVSDIGIIEPRGRLVVAIERDGGEEHILRVGA